ncbi:MAG: hypothetical protein Fur0037_23360 [Planctomycetota bacterium]
MRIAKRVRLMSPLLRVLLASLFCCALVPAQDDPARLDAVREFQRYFRQKKDEAWQVEAIMTLKGNECVPAAEELLKLLKSHSDALRKAAADVIATYRDPETWKPWVADLSRQDDDTKATLAKVFGLARLAQAVPALRGLLEGGRASPTLKFEIARAFRLIGDPSVGPALRPMLSDPDPLVRMAAADCAGALKIKELGDELVLLLGDKEWQVRTSAIAAVGRLRPQSAVQPLIDLMREEGRLQIECAEALFRITGFEFGTEVDLWQKQWNNLMAIPGWRIPTDEELAAKAANRKKYDELYGKKEGRNKFVGIPTTSTRVLFIIDVSGSMDDYVVEKEKFKDQGYEDYKKLTIVKSELLRTIDGLEKNTYFDIVAFAADLDAWKGRLVPANVINKESAKSWVRRLKALGGSEAQAMAEAGLGGSATLAAGKTNTLKALLYPFGIDPDNPPKHAFTGAGKTSIKNSLDTVYFLSDGRPSTGKLVDVGEILAEVERYNEVFKIVFHAIAIGEFQKEFLRDLANRTGGVFVDLGR